MVKFKKETYKKYKFTICYENVKGIPGCIPIYRSAPNITTHIPADTFIDRRKF